MTPNDELLIIVANGHSLKPLEVEHLYNMLNEEDKYFICTALVVLFETERAEIAKKAG